MVYFKLIILELRFNFLDNDECEIPAEHVGLAWDILCFGFLIFQRRMFNSHYFFRIVDETKAMAILASRYINIMKHFLKVLFNPIETFLMTFLDLVISNLLSNNCTVLQKYFYNLFNITVL